MPVTGLRGRQILDGDVFRNDLNVTSSTQAVVARLVAGTNISISSTNANMTGTGDVTINATGLLPLTGGTLTGNLGLSNATSPFTNYIQFGDNTGWTFRLMTLVSGTPTERFRFVDNGDFQAVGQIRTTRANSATDGNGQIYLNGATGNRIDFNINGVAAPSLTTRSAGTKIVLYPAVSGTLTDYAFGIEGDTLWSSVASASGQFKWYGATQLNMHLSGQNLLVGSGVGVGAGRLTVGAAAGGTSLYLTDATNSTLFITHTGGGRTNFFNGTATQWLMEVGGNVTIGNNSSAPSKLWIYNTSTTTNSLEISTQSALTSLQDSVPLRFNDLYNSGANGHNLIFTSTASTGQWEYNITKTFAGILTLGVASAGAITRNLYLYSGGQLRLSSYTTTTSFTGTLVGYLGFTSDGSIITTAAPSGSTQWVTSGSNIYYSAGNVSIGTATSDAKLRVSGTTNGTQAIFASVDGRGLEIKTLLVDGTNEGGSILNARSSVNSAALIIQTDGTEQARFKANGDIGIGTATPTNLANYRTIDIVGGTVGSLIRFCDSTATFRGAIYGSTAETAINAVSQFNLYVNSSQKFNANTTEVNSYETFYARKLGAQIQLAGGVATASGIYQAGNNFLYISDWATGSNGIIIDVSNGVLRTRSSAAGGGYIQFQRSTSTDYGFIGNASALAFAPFNAATDLAIRSEGAILLVNSGNARAAMLGTGQLRLINYTATNSFTGTLVGYLGFTSDGSVITTAAPSGSSQWTTNGTAIYYNTGNIGLGPTTPLQKIHILTANGTAAMVRFDQTDQRIFDIGCLASSTAFTIRDVSASANRFQVLSTGQFVFNAYTSFNSFSATDAQGILGFDTSGNIISMAPPIYRNIFIQGVAINATPPSNISFYNSSNAFVTKMDLTGKKRARLMGRVTSAGIGSAVLRVRYSLTFTTTASSYLTMGTSEIEISLSATGHFDSGWINLVAGAKADVFIALLTNGGDGSDQLAVSMAVLEAEE